MAAVLIGLICNTAQISRPLNRQPEKKWRLSPQQPVSVARGFLASIFDVCTDCCGQRFFRLTLRPASHRDIKIKAQPFPFVFAHLPRITTYACPHLALHPPPKGALCEFRGERPCFLAISVAPALGRLANRRFVPVRRAGEKAFRFSNSSMTMPSRSCSLLSRG